jgi:hypothetical protein
MSAQYVQHGGDLSFPGPVVCEGANLYCFILEGQPQNLQALCNKVFAAPSGGQANYYPISRYFMLSIGYIPKIYSPNFKVGYTPEAQAVVWIPTAAVRPSGSKLIAARLAMFPAYTIVSNPFSLATGREMNGFFKGFGWVDVPENDTVINPARLGADVYGVKQYGVNSTTDRYPLFELTRSGGVDGQAGNEWATLEAAFNDLRDQLRSHDPNPIVPSLELGFSLIDDLLHRAMPLVFLKQFRNAANDGGVAYQAVLEEPTVIQRFRGLKLIDEYQFTLLNTIDTYPWADELGVANQKALISFRLEMDFTIGAATEIWNSAQPQRRGCLGFLFGK